MPIEDLARSDVVTAPSETSVTELATTMDEQNVGSIVITEGETPVGIVTDRDLTVRVLAEQADRDETAANVMSDDLCTIDSENGFYQAAQLMSEHGIRRLPVCNENDELTGIITADDLTELLADEQQQLAEAIRAQRPPY
ncbi:CBS domain-containing protein [Halorussus salinisoli]|uniref:CBS domain-containing protein n=1 Tax=Halorussus salinisoli TaxID=2558242 RepID=UPI0010C1B54E|nr:CBS domain-containing protein [Halorussus salinisoli]